MTTTIVTTMQRVLILTGASTVHVIQGLTEMELFVVSAATIYLRTFFSYLTDCSDGDVLLMNGSTPAVDQTEGRVEICYDDQYWTICDDYWGIEDAGVICRQLNFTGTGTARRCWLLSIGTCRLNRALDTQW